VCCQSNSPEHGKSKDQDFLVRVSYCFVACNSSMVAIPVSCHAVCQPHL
jgi:hypothetical protein